MEDLQKWKTKQFNRFGKCELVFCSRTKSKLDPKDVRDMIKKYALKAGIHKNISTHTLRHTFGTDLLRATKNIRLVQKALGHSDLSTTMIYTHIVDDEFEDALKSYRKMLK